jgi:micrococcal nuclease
MLSFFTSAALPSSELVLVATSTPRYSGGMNIRMLMFRIAGAFVVVGGLAMVIAHLPAFTYPAGTESVSSPAPQHNLKAIQSAVSIGRVLRVVDGDTLRVALDGKTVAIRLIGINAPESVTRLREGECYGREALEALEHLLLSSSQISLVSDESQQDMDRYGRLLRYVYLEDGTFVNEWLVANGFAVEYTYDRPYEFQARFREVQHVAVSEQRGLWRDCDRL